ncbi:glycogen synthase GlgA [Candidatus Omnitrophota bacterium]
MDILFISSEVFPFAKTGGLADVIGALPEAISKRGHKCSVILPYYKCVKDKNFSPDIFKKDGKVKINGKEHSFDLYLLKHKDVDVYFVEKDEYYKRDYLYGTPQGDYPDSALRFGFFAKAIIASIPYIGRQDLLHCNDWQSSLMPLYIELFHRLEPALSNTKILLTIHNMAYQGLFKKEVMVPLGIPEDLFNPEGLEFYGKINFMKAGIIYSDAISTVSEGYGREILTPEFGCGLDDLLRTRKEDLCGIVNGVDYSVWDPATDKFIVTNYDEKNLAGKEDCKKDILKEFGIRYDPERPLIGMITRLAEQKGIDLVAESMEELIKLQVDFVLLGFGDEKYNKIFRRLAKKYKHHVGARIDFDNALAHKIEAGSDMFLMPSRYEPCGLNQLYSLKYATVPIVRAVGGLDDTVSTFNRSTKKGNGFKFKDASSDALLGAIKDAVTVFKDKDLWNALLKNCLLCDYSWDASAEKYERLYKKLCSSQARKCA